MHIMSKHVPQQMRSFGGIIRFSGQGLDAFCIQRFMCTLLDVEKNNDDARRNYMSSNHHDAPKEVLLTEVRQHTLRMYAREKRRYQKSANDYWERDILSQRRQRI